MSFFQALFSSTNNITNNNNTTTTTIHHNQKSSYPIKHHHHRHQKQPSLSLRSNLTLPNPSRRHQEKEDEEIYGPPSPHPSPPLSSSNLNTRIHSHQTFKPASISINSSRSPSLSPSSPSNLNQPNTLNSTTDELFLSEHYPPIQSKLYPFFNERLSSPIGMGKGQIIPTKSNSNHNLKSIWNRISKTLSQFNPDLIETLSYPVDSLSLLNLESVLQSYNLTLPTSVKDSLQTHDGQDVFSTSSGSNDGLVYGLWLMSTEEIETEYGFWRKLDNGQLPNDAFNATDFHKPNSLQLHSNHQSLMQNQMSSCPAGWIHEVYSHPGWLPLLTDRVGNYIGVDLSPPINLDSDHDLNLNSNHSKQEIIGGGQGNSQASIGQVIAFGREIDEKVVLWNGDGEEGWGKWLSSFADDLEQGNFAIPAGSHHQSNSNSKRFSNQSSSNHQNDDESGWKVESDEDEEDGIGELGYFNDGNTEALKTSKDSKVWKLSNQFRGMNIIEALCERSKRRWSEIGLYSSSSNRLPLHGQKPSLQPHSRPGPSIPHPTYSPHQHPPPGFASGSHASLSSQPDTPIAFVTPPSPRPSTDQLRPDPSTSTNLNVMNPKPVRKRTIPPVPASLSLPTLDDMIKAGNSDGNEEDEEGIGLESPSSNTTHNLNNSKEIENRLNGLGIRNQNEIELQTGSLESIGMSMIKLDEMKIANQV